MTASIFTKIKGDIRPIKDHVLVINMERGDKLTKGGLILLDDNGKDRGIRPRWCQVWKIGPNQHDLKPGQWVLVEHGRWTWGFETVPQEGDEDPLYVQRVDIAAILLASDECPL